MSQYKYYFRYGMTDTWSESPIYRIGASAYLTYDKITAHNNENSIYVSWDGEDSTNADGTQENPFRTIQYAMDFLDSHYLIITIMDSNYYYTGVGAELFIDINNITIQGREGEKPILTIDPLLADQEKMIRLQGAGSLVNIELQIPDGYVTQVIGVDVYDGILQNVTITNSNKNSINKTTSGVLTMSNCILENSRNEGSVDGSGITISEGTINLNYCLINDNDYCGIISTGSSTKVLALNYCTVVNNQYGILTSGSSNLTLTIQNSIIYKNKIYDHYGDLGTYTYSCVGKIQGSPTLTTTTIILRVNPLFISMDDFRIRTKYNGYADSLTQSPCVGVSSSYTDLGCYQYTRILSSQNYTEIELPAPDTINKTKNAIDVKLYTTISLKMRSIKRGVKNGLDISWSGMDNVLTEPQMESIRSMFDNDNDEIYLSIDNKVTFTKYVYNKTRDFSTSRALNIIENTYYIDITISLIEV